MLRYPKGGVVTAILCPRRICWKVEPSGGKFRELNFSGCRISLESRKIQNIKCFSEAICCYKCDWSKIQSYFILILKIIIKD